MIVIAHTKIMVALARCLRHISIDTVRRLPSSEKIGVEMRPTGMCRLAFYTVSPTATVIGGTTF